MLHLQIVTDRKNACPLASDQLKDVCWWGDMSIIPQIYDYYLKLPVFSCLKYICKHL